MKQDGTGEWDSLIPVSHQVFGQAQPRVSWVEEKAIADVDVLEAI